jgi:hypothetical protein
MGGVANYISLNRLFLFAVVSTVFFLLCHPEPGGTDAEVDIRVLRNFISDFKNPEACPNAHCIQKLQLCSCEVWHTFS